MNAVAHSAAWYKILYDAILAFCCVLLALDLNRVLKRIKECEKTGDC